MSKNIIPYLKLLAKNNNKDWFHKNRDLYDNARQEFIELIEFIIKQIGAFDKTINNVASKDCVFRINRDIRFSKDKTPYKSNFGASIKKGGKKSAFAGYYIHIAPDNSFIGGGYYRPDNLILNKIREEIDYNTTEFLKIIHDKRFKKDFGEIKGEKLANPPKGYSKENPNIEWLKYKSYIAMQPIKDEEISKAGFEKDIITSFRNLHPFINFLNKNQ